MRADGNPIFFLANAVDDAAMGITHVIRGEDLLDSTHRVLALRAAIGEGPPPVYAHLPLIVGTDRAKLSKRHGAVAIEDFRADGYLPEAVCNYLALLGWGAEDGREIMDLDEIAAAFSLERVTQAAAAFDHKKLDWVNGEWIRRLSLAELEARARPLAEARFADRLDDDLFREALRIGQERAVTLGSLLDQMDFLFVDEADFAIAPDAWEKVVATERVADVFDAVLAHVEGCEWSVEAVDLRPALEPLGVKPRKALPAVYAAVEGRAAGLPLFDAIVLLGRERALGRIRAAAGGSPTDAERRRSRRHDRWDRPGGGHVRSSRLWDERMNWRWARRVMLGLLLLLVLYYVVTFIQVWQAAESDNRRASQAIIVLGAAQYDGRPSSVFRARLDHAADLWRDGVAPVIVVTGGSQPGDRFTEAGAGAMYLHSIGVPETQDGREVILRETTSRNSWESLAASARFLQKDGITKVVLVSDGFHSLRIQRIADELGFDAVTSPTQTSPITGLDEWWRYATEAVRVAFGQIFGFGRLDRASRVGTLGPEFGASGLGNLAGPSGVV